MSHDHDANYKCDDDQDQALVVSNQPADDDDLLAGLVLSASGEASDEEILGALADDPRQCNGSINAAAPPAIGNKPDTGGQDEVVSSADPQPASVARPSIPNYGEMWEANRIARKQRKDTTRQRRHRAKKEAIKREPDKARLDALLRVTARSRGNSSWVQLRGREEQLVRFRNTMGYTAHLHGTRFSMQQLADVYAEFIGKPFTRDQARRWRDTVRNLEAVGGPWHHL